MAEFVMRVTRFARKYIRMSCCFFLYIYRRLKKKRGENCWISIDLNLLMKFSFVILFGIADMSNYQWNFYWFFYFFYSITIFIGYYQQQIFHQKLPIEMFHCYFHQKNNNEILFVNFFIVNLTITNLIILIFYSFIFKSNKLSTLSLFIKQPRTKLSRLNLMNETSKKRI
jgi:hypothetical protein